MNWFIIALITPIAHSIVNHLDKYLLSKYFKGGTVGALVLFSSIFAIFALPFIYFFNANAISLKTTDALLLMLNGVFIVLAYICYFYALDKDEASFVAPLFQLIPVLGFILGYFILGETLSVKEFIGSLIVIAGAVILSIELGDSRIKVKKAVILLMFGSSLLYAINAVVFKFVTETQMQFWPALFWDLLGKALFGILIFLCIKSYRQEFIAIFKQNKAPILTMSVFGEILALVGEGALVFATLLAPVALVQVVSGFQPMFVFIIGVLLTLFLPRFGQESLKGRHLVQKLVGIVIIIVGTTLINNN